MTQLSTAEAFRNEYFASYNYFLTWKWYR